MSTKYPPTNYSDYLQVDKLLECQHLRSEEFGDPAHDEMLFIIVHQAYELWFRQMLHELDSVMAMFSNDYVPEKDIGTSVARLRRVNEIQKILIGHLSVLETMTPLDFLEFRNYLFPASGFQSVQFRLIENKFGLPPERRLLYNKTPYYSQVDEQKQAVIHAAEDAPSLFHLIEKWLERTPFLEFEGFSFWQNYRDAVKKMYATEREALRDNPNISEKERDAQLKHLEKSEAHFQALFDEDQHNQLVQEGYRRLSHRAMQAALFINLYRDESILQLPFRLLTVLIDIDELFADWRYRHALMVHRMIGVKVGTGGSSGYDYLKNTVEHHRIFSDFLNLSTFLIPRSALPDLPAEFEKNLNFYYKAK